MKVNPAGSHKVYRPRQSQTPPPAKEVNPGALFRRRFSAAAAAAAKNQAIFLVDYLVSGLGWIRLSSHECWNQSACSREIFFGWEKMLQAFLGAGKSGIIQIYCTSMKWGGLHITFFSWCGKQFGWIVPARDGKFDGWLGLRRFMARRNLYSELTAVPKTFLDLLLLRLYTT